MLSRTLSMFLQQSLLNVLHKRVGGNLARLKCLSDAVCSLIKSRSVNLVHVANQSTSHATLDSSHRRLQRFMSEWDIPRADLTRLILSKIPKPRKGYILSIDRTNWQFGQTHINILTIGVIVGPVAVPLVWRTLPQASKRGNSNTEHRIQLLSELLRVLPAEHIDFIAMDREFHGKKWLKWVDLQGLTYVLRLKANILVGGKSARDYQRSCLEKQTICGLKLYFGRRKVDSKRTDILYVASNRFSARRALNAYKRRWGIEVLFGHLKKKGLNLEDTHLREAEKIDRLIAVVTLSFFYCFGWGALLKKHCSTGKKQQRKSHFRLGLESLISLLQRSETQIPELVDKWFQNLPIPRIFVV